MFDNQGRFIIGQYQIRPEFSSFLPGIAGKTGIPVWCFYVNRGQGIASFGVGDKEHSILEFSPAHQAYQAARNMGFRTFIKVNGEYYEPFHTAGTHSDMHIGMNELVLEEVSKTFGIKICVTYYTLPNEPLGGLVREVAISNLTNDTMEIDLLDGLPALIPYGVSLTDYKNMAQTMKAWMQAEDVQQNMPYYRVRYSTKDSAQIARINGGNFMLALSKEGERLPVICDPGIIFGYDTAFEVPVGFLEKGAEELAGLPQNLQNQVPCGFSCQAFHLKGGECRSTYEIIGQASGKSVFHQYANQNLGSRYFTEKQREARKLAEDLTQNVKTVTAHPVFDAYCRQTYLDNLLRGGYPIRLGKEGVFYIYSRKHGDLERDYNFFTMLPEYYSQGNGNYRDVNQNRRSDVLFAPFIKDYNVKLFYNLIQLDGYNPLVVQQVTYRLKEKAPVLKAVKKGDGERLLDFMSASFSPGRLFAFMEENQIALNCGSEEFMGIAADCCVQEINADFSEGYWTDHFTYNLDLVESYLKVYPEEEETLLFLDKSYTYYSPQARVVPRADRYVRTEHGVRQYHALEEIPKSEGFRDCLYVSNLMTKLMVIAANKFSSLDMCGMGIEMEAGKPGWYDALNGLPGIFGSSMSETYELQRLLEFMTDEINKYEQNIPVPVELYELIIKLQDLIEQYHKEKPTKLSVWNRMNTTKEEYRMKIASGISGKEEVLSHNQTVAVLELWKGYISEGIASAVHRQKGMPPTYFAYEFSDYVSDENGLLPENPGIMDLPDFLEGPVHYFKLLKGKKQRQELYMKIKSSGLYDKKLNMYKVNDSLKEVSFEAGRAKAFSPGWLENESIWLHMEYKYLLELLKAELYQEFFVEFYHAAVPFLEYDVYGRSPLENVSFLVSSANENKDLWGRGFVARLSGATAEFLQMFTIMMFGASPFDTKEGSLVCELKPAVPKYLIPESGRIEAVFLGQTKVIYEFGGSKDIVPGDYTVEKMIVRFKSGEEIVTAGGVLRGDNAVRLREGEMEEIRIFVRF